MTAAVDHFTSFVQLLSEVLDDHEATPEQLASRLYLSRFHLDRIVASVAGEPPRRFRRRSPPARLAPRGGGDPPSRFRRRILLERAAYRLATPDGTILDVAVEAGYG